jgi:hypothetical protein
LYLPLEEAIKEGVELHRFANESSGRKWTRKIAGHGSATFFPKF